MDPITSAISGFSPANILLAGAAVITLVITIVGIDKIRDMISGEAVAPTWKKAAFTGIMMKTGTPLTACVTG